MGPKICIPQDQLRKDQETWRDGVQPVTCWKSPAEARFWLGKGPLRTTFISVKQMIRNDAVLFIWSKIYLISCNAKLISKWKIKIVSIRVVNCICTAWFLLPRTHSILDPWSFSINHRSFCQWLWPITGHVSFIVGFEVTVSEYLSRKTRRSPPLPRNLCYRHLKGKSSLLLCTVTPLAPLRTLSDSWHWHFLTKSIGRGSCMRGIFLKENNFSYLRKWKFDPWR